MLGIWEQKCCPTAFLEGGKNAFSKIKRLRFTSNQLLVASSDIGVLSLFLNASKMPPRGRT